MDPISALIGGGASLIGGFLNRSSQQSINSQNFQNALFMAQNSKLFAAQDATRAQEATGINRLALLGQGVAPGSTAVAPMLGDAVAQAGKFAAGIKDPHTVQMEKDAEEKSKVDIAIGNNTNLNTMIQGAIQNHLLKYLQSHPDSVPAGASEPSVTGEAVQGWKSIMPDFHKWYEDFKKSDQFDWSPPMSEPARRYFNAPNIRVNGR